MEKGIDYSDIIDNSFYTKTYIQNQILGRALLESVLFYDGKCIFSLVTQDEMNFYGVTGRELGGIVEQLRLTEGVEVAIFLYQTGEEEYKVSLRSKKVIDVSKIAMHYAAVDISVRRALRQTVQCMTLLTILVPELRSSTMHIDRCTATYV